MKYKNKHIITTIFFCSLVMSVAWAQKLTKREAIRLTLENNYGILIATNAIEAAKNNKGILNSGYLPSITGTARADYQLTTTNTSFPDSDDPDREIKGAETQSYNVGLNLNYTLFDGLGRFYNYKKLKAEHNLTQLEARETIENTILQLFSVYYEVARLSENVKVLEETLHISKERVTRSEYQFEYGQNTKLNVLNAQVDVANDSINLLNTRQQLINTRRDLAVILDSKKDKVFSVDTVVQFIPKLRVDEYMKKAKENNVTLLRNRMALHISDYDVKISKSGYLPTVDLVGSYGWNQSRNPPRIFFPSNIGNTTTLSAGINLSWNLFDGGTTITRLKNAKIALDNQELLIKQLQVGVERDMENALGTYQNRLKIFEIQQQNVSTNQHNFKRSKERFKLGQITSIEFRQAQINLLNAKTNKNLAKYNAKIAELQLLQLTGQLLNVDF